MKKTEIQGRGYNNLVWEPRMMERRGLSRLEGILRLRFDYARTKGMYFLSPLSHDREQGTEIPDAPKK
jgi:hypothetical protein